MGAVEAALVYYTGRLDLDRDGLPRPDALLEIIQGRQDLALEVHPAPAVEAVLREAAERFRLPVGRIVTHAVLLYLADLDAASEAAGGRPKFPSDPSTGNASGEPTSPEV